LVGAEIEFSPALTDLTYGKFQLQVTVNCRRTN
jgi:hypothetical protein